MATPVVGDGEGVAAGHTGIERHLDQSYSRYVTYLAVSQKLSRIIFLLRFRLTDTAAGVFDDPDISL
jgi:hypothetical protein